MALVMSMHVLQSRILGVVMVATRFRDESIFVQRRELCVSTVIAIVVPRK